MEMAGTPVYPSKDTTLAMSRDTSTNVDPLTAASWRARLTQVGLT